MMKALDLSRAVDTISTCSYALPYLRRYCIIFYYSMVVTCDFNALEIFSRSQVAGVGSSMGLLYYFYLT